MRSRPRRSPTSRSPRGGRSRVSFTAPLASGAVTLADLSVYPYVDLLPAKVVAATMPIPVIDSATLTTLVSGSVCAMAVYIPSGVTVHSISFLSGTTALATGTHQVFGLYDNNLNLLATTTDDTSTAWAAQSIKTLTLTPSDFTTTYDGLYYVAILVAATTVPSLTGEQPPTVTPLLASPYYAALYNTGQTALPATLAFSATRTSKPYAHLSSP